MISLEEILPLEILEKIRNEFGEFVYAPGERFSSNQIKRRFKTVAINEELENGTYGDMYTSYKIVGHFYNKRFIITEVSEPTQIGMRYQTLQE